MLALASLVRLAGGCSLTEALQLAESDPRVFDAAFLEGLEMAEDMARERQREGVRRHETWRSDAGRRRGESARDYADRLRRERNQWQGSTERE